MPPTRPADPLNRNRAIQLVLCLCLGGCSAPKIVPAQTPTPEKPASTPASDTAFPRGPRKPFSAKTLPIDLLIPGLTAFVVTETKSSLLLSHRASSSEIRVRFWSTSRIVTETQCEQELALLDPDATVRERVVGASPAVASQAFAPGPEYRGVVHSKVQSTPDGPLVGYVHGIAAGLGHCVSFDAKTEMAHPHAEQEMAERLALLMDGIAASLRLRQAERSLKPAALPFDGR